MNQKYTDKKKRLYLETIWIVINKSEKSIINEKDKLCEEYKRAKSYYIWLRNDGQESIHTTI